MMRPKKDPLEKTFIRSSRKLGLPQPLLVVAFVAVLMVCVVHPVIAAAAGDIEWEKTFDTGNKGKDQWANWVEQTSDGGFILTGTSKEAGAGYLFLYKTNPQGDFEKMKGYGGALKDEGFSVKQTKDGGYLAVGSSQYWEDPSVDWTWFLPGYGLGSLIYDLFTQGKSLEFITIKTDSNLFGKEVYHRWKGADIGLSGQETSDGGVVVVGGHGTETFGGQALLVKYNSNLVQIWEKSIGGKQSDIGTSMQQTSDGGYIIVGSTKSFGAHDYYDIYLVKTDVNGNEEWSRPISGYRTDVGSEVRETSDGGYIIVGSTTPYPGTNTDVWLVKTDNLGNVLWEKRFGTDRNEYGKSVKQTSDGGYIIVGNDKTINSGSDIMVIRTDGDGNTIWSKTIGGVKDDVATSVQQTTDGGYIIAGWTNSKGGGGRDIYLVKIIPEPTWNLSIKKYISKDNQTWNDDNVYVTSGSRVYYRIDVTNEGNQPIERVEVWDNNNLIKSIEDMPSGEAKTYYYSAIAVSGPTNYYKNTATAYYSVGTVIDYVVDSASYQTITTVLKVRADFNGTPLTGYAPLTVHFNATPYIYPTINPTTYYWNFGDFGTSTQKNPDHVYKYSGSYNVSLNVTNSGSSNTKTKNFYITVKIPSLPPPIANFTAKPTSGVAPLKVTFNSTSTRVSGSTFRPYFWQFGDGTNSTQRNVTHVYQYMGNYNVHLTVNTSTGSSTKSAMILVNSPGFGSLTLLPEFSTSLIGTPQELTATLLNEAGSPLTGKSITFVVVSGPHTGSIGSAITNSSGMAKISYTGTKIGTDYIEARYTVVQGSTVPSDPVLKVWEAIMVTSPNGGESWVRGTTPTITWASSGSVGSYVKIELLKAGAVVQSVSSYTLNDGTFSSWTIPTGQATGTDYQIQITSATNAAINDTSNGNFEITSGAITSKMPIVKFTTNVTYGKPPLAVKFTDQSTGLSLTRWNWSFGDNSWFNTTIAGQKDPVHVYNSAGTFTAKLTVCNASGCNTTVPGTTIISSTPATSIPIVKFTTNVSSGNVPLAVKFTDSSTGLSLTKWNWSFGDNSWFNTTIAGQKDPIHVYNNAGTFTAKLTVCNASGCNTTIPGKTITSGIITPSITVTVPNGGESWPRMMGTGTPRLIKWSYTGNPGSTVKVELLKGGAFYKLLTSGTSIGSAGSGSYPWTISADTALGTDYKVRVTSTSNSVYNDTSNANFIIN